MFYWHIDYYLYNHSFTTNTKVKPWSVQQNHGLNCGYHGLTIGTMFLVLFVDKPWLIFIRINIEIAEFHITLFHVALHLLYLMSVALPHLVLQVFFWSLKISLLSDFPNKLPL